MSEPRAPVQSCPDDCESHFLIEQQSWRELCSKPMSIVRRELKSTPLPSLLEKAWGIRWSLHPKFSCFAQRPGQMLIATMWFANGASAVLAYGCDSAELDGSYSESGPWRPWVGMAARQGDPSRGSFVACFDLDSKKPSLSVARKSFEGEGPVSGLGRSSAIFETADAREASEALGLLAQMPSMWDEPEQEVLWSCAREGRSNELRALLARYPEWARRRWSVGGSLGEVCARLGDWEGCRAVAEAGARFEAEEARGLSRAVALCALDSFEHFAMAAAPKMLCKAWSAGLRLDKESWLHSIAEEKSARNLASRAWSDAEALWLSQGGGAGAAAQSKRL